MDRTKYEVRLLRVAEDDLTEIIQYVAADRHEAAIKLADAFNKKLAVLANSPYIGRVAHEDSLTQLGYRYLLVDNYLVFYVIEAQVIYVHRIIHGARDYRRLL